MNPEIVSFQYATGMCLLLENVGGCEQNQLGQLQMFKVTTSGLPACTQPPTFFFGTQCIMVNLEFCKIVMV